MERRNLALLCAGVVCFWLFALTFGTAQGKGLRIQPAVQAQAASALSDSRAAQTAAILQICTA